MKAAALEEGALGASISGGGPSVFAWCTRNGRSGSPGDGAGVPRGFIDCDVWISPVAALRCDGWSMNVGSTRGGSTDLPLADALLRGTAPDGGLFVPARLPPGRGCGRRDTLPDSALAMLAPFFAGERLERELPAMVAEAFTFPAPLVPLRNRGDFVWSCSTARPPPSRTSGPGSCGLHASAASGRRWYPHRRVVTSGDTGGAVAAAFHRMRGVRVVLLYPDGRVSPRQAHQLGAFGENVTALRVAGTFDECQAMVKAAFTDPDLAPLRLTSANSISLGRLLPQLAYHAYAACASGANAEPHRADREPGQRRRRGVGARARRTHR